MNGVAWTVWPIGRIYPPEGTYWIEATTGTNLEKRSTEMVPLTLPAVVTIAKGDHLLIQYMKDGQAVRISPI